MWAIDANCIKFIVEASYDRDIEVDTRHVQTVPANGAKRGTGDCCLISEGKFKFHSVLFATAMRPGMVLYSGECECIVYFIE